ncbi:molybdate ABC transporter permease subunit [Pseudomarimonas arenosa]|uniref:Molybdenum transport system permease n=1 Tax=Pseudomarimonas arenosa TaxID=2774145 RepID=A0AAW3ZLE5_9GAMM|nr:molybdate ABC transporter permease subunit [Pseudomarimonas arenosa]MBD8526339.1 molybdate ABC transporter permease subunit [Pseudomarimonas arenosa]
MIGLSPAEWSALKLTLWLALSTTGLLLLLCIPLAGWLALGRSRVRAMVEVLVALPLVLPPTVLGFYLLLLLGPRGPVGQAAAALGLGPLVFSFKGLLIGSMLYSLPFAVQPLLDGFRSMRRELLDTAASLGAGPIERFFRVVLPLSRPAVLSAALLSFAHTLGEFGVVLMIGGNIAGETRVMSIAIYDAVEAFDFAEAHRLSAWLLGLAMVCLLAIQTLRRRQQARDGGTDQ